MLGTPDPTNLLCSVDFPAFSHQDAADFQVQIGASEGESCTQPECYRLSKSAQLFCSIAFLTTNLTAAATSLEVLAHRAPAAHATMAIVVLYWAALFAFSKRIAGRRIHTSRDLVAFARAECGMYAGILAAAVATTIASLTPATGNVILVSLSTGYIVLVLGRVAIIAMSAQVRSRWTENVLLIGSAQAIGTQLRSRLCDQTHCEYGGAIVVGGGTVSLPLFGRIGAAAQEAMAAAAGAHEQVAMEGGALLGDRQARRLLGRIDRIVLLEDGLGPDDKLSTLAWLDRFSHEVHVIKPRSQEGEAVQKALEACVLVKPATMQPAGFCLKRTLDILLSAAALIVMLPGLLIIAALIRAESKGPALFRQLRLGCDNLPFTVLKFRTMRQNNATDGSIQAVRGDTRVTPLGAILRKTSIDELPQLLNVLNGSMSLVGPRPHPITLNSRFEPMISSYAARHSVLPGITGWAQINGARGETPTVEAMQRRIALDLEYIRRQSILLDVWILLRTVSSVMKASNVY